MQMISQPIRGQELPVSLRHNDDVDIRIRWMAVHGLLRLALLQEQQTIEAFTVQYLRTADLLYRQPDAPFYHIAGRLWFLIAADQAASAAPASVACLRDAVGNW